MNPQVTFMAPNVFTVTALFTPEECQALIDRGEAIGYQAASVTTSGGPQMMLNIRNNDRANFEDPGFARSVWLRVKDFVPSIIAGFQAVGLNERFRFYRYDPEQRFKRHKDGVQEGLSGARSRLTFLIYLNEGYGGGETIFTDYAYEGVEKKMNQIVITGQTGMGLFFAHERWHEGAPVLQGRKYVLRTDVIDLLRKYQVGRPKLYMAAIKLKRRPNRLRRLR